MGEQVGEWLEEEDHYDNDSEQVYVQVDGCHLLMGRKMERDQIGL